MALTHDELMEHGYRQLAAILRGMSGGKIPFDMFRNPDTRLKADLASYIIRSFSEQNIRAAAAAAGVSLRKAELPETKAVPESHSGSGSGERGDGGEDGDGDGADGEQNSDGDETGDETGDGDGDGDESDEGGDGGDANPNDKQQQSAAQDGKEQEQKQDASGKQGNTKRRSKNEPPPPENNEHRHPIFDKVYRLASNRINVMLVGPAGCGKTHLFGQVMRALKMPYASISGSAGASESQLLGRLLPTGDGGRFEYHAAPFVNVYEGVGDFDGGGGFLFDEIDAFDPNMLVVTNQATANGSFYHEARFSKPRVTRCAKSILMAAANTYGVGAGAMYVGRNQLDAATLDRWYVVEMDYDRVYEESLGPKSVIQWVWDLRAKAQASHLRRVVSTRMIQKMGLAVDAGLSVAEVKRDLLSGWTKDELAKCGVSV